MKRGGGRAEVERSRQGACQSGSCRFTAAGAPVSSLVCHCDQCRRRTGAAFGVSVYYPAEAVTAEGPLKDWGFVNGSGRRTDQRFCAECGATLLWALELRPGRVCLPGGLFAPPWETPPTGEASGDAPASYAPPGG